MKRLRVGTKVPRHVYEGDEPLFTAPSEELAAEIVEAVNAFRMGGEVAKRIERDPRDAANRRRMSSYEIRRVFGTPPGGQ